MRKRVELARRTPGSCASARSLPFIVGASAARRGDEPDLGYIAIRRRDRVLSIGDLSFDGPDKRWPASPNRARRTGRRICHQCGQWRSREVTDPPQSISSKADGDIVPANHDTALTADVGNYDSDKSGSICSGCAHENTAVHHDCEAHISNSKTGE